MAETCDPENEIEVVTHVSVEGAHESDQPATIPVLDDLESKGCKPETLLADTNYGRGQNIVDAAQRGVDLVSPSCGPKPKADEGDFILDDFRFSSDGERIEHCPMGQEPVEQGTCGKAGRRRYARMDAKRCGRCSWTGHCPARRSDRATTVTLTWLPAAGATSARLRRVVTGSGRRSLRTATDFVAASRRRTRNTNAHTAAAVFASAAVRP